MKNIYTVAIIMLLYGCMNNDKNTENNFEEGNEKLVQIKKQEANKNLFVTNDVGNIQKQVENTDVDQKKNLSEDNGILTGMIYDIEKMYDERKYSNVHTLLKALENYKTDPSIKKFFLESKVAEDYTLGLIENNIHIEAELQEIQRFKMIPSGDREASLRKMSEKVGELYEKRDENIYIKNFFENDLSGRKYVDQINGTFHPDNY